MSSDNNYKSAEKTYSGFIGLLKWGTLVTIVLTAFVVLLIS